MSAFLDRAVVPDDAAAAAVLGPMAESFATLRAHVASRFGPLTEVWSWSGKAYGWTLALKRKKRPLLYLTPEVGWFRASVALSDAAVVAAQGAGLPEEVLATIAAAPRFPEGLAVRIEVRDGWQVEGVERLVAVRVGG